LRFLHHLSDVPEELTPQKSLEVVTHSKGLYTGVCCTIFTVVYASIKAKNADMDSIVVLQQKCVFTMVEETMKGQQVSVLKWDAS
jgi:hypothetical protein